MLVISDNLSVPDDELVITTARSQGPGGQHVNTTETAVHLRFDINASSLPDHYKQRLLQLTDSRINAQGVLIIKAQRHRSQQKNRQDALERLKQIIQSAGARPPKRIATRPGKGAKRKRLDEKAQRGKLKQLRRRPGLED